MYGNRQGILALYLTLLLLVRYGESEPTCDKLIGRINNCRCRYSDGGVPPTYRTIDFSPLGRNDGKPAFTYKVNPSDNFQYAYNPCHPFQDEHCTEDTAACQLSSTQQGFRIGNPNVVDFRVIDSDIVLTYAEVESRVAVVTFNCDKDALNGAKYEPLGEITTPEAGYGFKIGTCLACLEDVPGCHTADSGGSDLSIGGILCIVFAVLVVVYFVGGILVQKFGRGATGKELIPNYEFWKGLPVLIKDGVNFVICCGGGGGSSNRSDYDSIK